ncbi:MAG: DUF5665 domain-containing protein [Gorillibacterium sp.]|nr:DUF5665 domain-containing protein [Gorillibacterium sp.]
MKDQANESDRHMLYEMNERIKKVAAQMERVQISDYIQLMNHPWRLVFNNLLGGLARGVGIAIGVTLFTSTIIYVLQLLGALNLPIIGDYIAKVVEVVQSEMDSHKAYR